MPLTNADVLLVEGDRALEDLLKSLGAHVRGTTNDALAALTGPVSPVPALVVVDVRHRPFMAAALVTFRRHHPTSLVLMVVSRLESSQLLEAMRAGITEVVAEPLSRDELSAAIERTRATVPAAAGRVLAFIGSKGGSGCTTTAVNVATALGLRHPSSVLLIDLHPMYGDAALLLGTHPKRSVADALQNAHRLDQTLLGSLVTRAHGIDLLASPETLESGGIGVAQVRALLAIAASRYEYTVLDIPNCDPVIIEGLDIAALILVLVTQDLASLHGAARLMAMLKRRFGNTRVGALLSREDPVAAITRADVERAIGEPVRFVLPSDYRATAAALNAGRPLAVDDDGTLAEAYRALAANLAGPDGVEQGAVAGRRRGRRGE